MFPSPADRSIGSSPSSSADPLNTFSNQISFSDLEQYQDTSDDDRNVSPTSSESSSKNRYLYPRNDTVENLRPEEIRWLYKEETDKKPKWRVFLGYDSLRLECKFREIQQRKDASSGDIDEEAIIVRGGLYQVDVMKKQCVPIYWTGKSEDIKVMRGTWFVDGNWQPVEEENALKIEQQHLKHFEGQKIPDSQTSDQPCKGPPPVLLNLKFKEFHVDWNAVDKVYLFSEATSSKLYRAVGNKLGLSKSGTRLYRGYCYEATMEDKPPDISHLIFVVHGIGQKMDTGSIIKSCADLRVTVRKVKERFMPELDSNNKRVEFLPVEWRSSLKLDGDTVESITPHKVKGLRTILNSSAMDILYYTSPLYRSEITHGLQTELNRLYAMFCDRNPYFQVSGGKVSIVAHSLGCVITYDIITGWNPKQLYDQYVAAVLDEKTQGATGCDDIIAELEKARKKVNSLESQLLAMTAKQQLHSSALNFKLDSFFCLGSPLAVFLALRAIRPKGDGTRSHILEKNLCRRLYNLYHPSDPVAYRLEPLILKHYAGIYPLRVHRVDSSNKVPYEKLKPRAYTVPNPATADQTDGRSNNSTPEKKAPKDQKSLSGALGSMLKGWGRKPKPSLTAELRVLEKSDQSGAETEDEVSFDVGSQEVLTQTELEYRLDYQLKEGKMENAYLSAITSHTSYWSNQDVALFLLSQLFPEFLS